MKHESVTIAMACDRPYLYPFAVALTSLVRHSPRPVHLLFGLASDWRLRLEQDDVERVLELAQAAGASAEARETEIAVNGLPPTLHISPTAFVKLAMLDQCPAGESVVWFDADLMARRDWTSLLEASSGHAASGVHEPQASFEENWPCSSQGWYVNTGVVAVDGDLWQQDYAGRWKEYVARYTDYDFRYLDQDVLNALIRDRWNRLPQGFNFRIGYSGVWTDPSIVHFAGWWKPWLRIRRQSRLLEGDWRTAFDEYAEAEAFLTSVLDDNLPREGRRYWGGLRRSVRGVGSWRATRHYVKGLLHE